MTPPIFFTRSAPAPSKKGSRRSGFGASTRKEATTKAEKRCRHVWGPERAGGPGDEHRICEQCGRVRFNGERYTFGSRSAR